MPETEAAAVTANEAGVEPIPELVEDAAAHPVAEHAPAARLQVTRLTLPKLSLPKFSAGRTKAEGEVSEEAPAADGTEKNTGVDTATDKNTATAEAIAAAPVAVESVPWRPADDAPAEAPSVAAAAEAGPVAGVVSIDVAVQPGKNAVRSNSEIVLQVVGLTKKFDDKVAVNSINLEVHVGEFYGIVGPNGAGKTTTLSMITGLLRPDSGAVAVHSADVWTDPVVAKRNMGVLPDRLRLFDKLTGAQVLYYAGVLRGLDSVTARKRSADLAGAFGLEDALGRLVSDYSAGMTKKIALAAAMIHSPRILVLDEPFESVDPVSAATITDILRSYAAAGGTVVLSSHSMDLVQRICDHVAVIVNGDLLADGTMASVRGGQTLEERFVELAGGRKTVEGLEWLHSFSD